MLKSVWYLVRKDLLLEWREKNALSSIVLYVLSTAFVIYQMFLTTEPAVWVALYWVITLFASVNAAAKSFIQENESKIQCVVGNYSKLDTIPFGKSQRPDLQYYADNVNTLNFLQNL
mgnify:CR=1 FL=1